MLVVVKKQRAQRALAVPNTKLPVSLNPVVANKVIVTYTKRDDHCSVTSVRRITYRSSLTSSSSSTLYSHHGSFKSQI